MDFEPKNALYSTVSGPIYMFIFSIMFLNCINNNPYGELELNREIMENLLTNDEIDWLCKFLEGKGSNNELIEKIVTITRKLQKMKRR